MTIVHQRNRNTRKSNPRKPPSFAPSLWTILAFVCCLCLVGVMIPVVSGKEAGKRDRSAGPVIGIDLGTTYSCVGVQKGGRIEIIPNDQGHRITPSWVSFSPTGERLVGDSAKQAFHSNPSNTVYDAKRLIGRSFADPDVQADLEHWPFQIINRNGKPLVHVTHRDEAKEFTPEEISSMVLMKLKETAEAYLGEAVTRAVVTVPAYFNDAQRQATKDAGTIAGLDVIRIISEPTAAAIAYGLDKKGGASNVIVYDLGGGTFDVSLLSIEDNFFEVLATAGNTHLGGEDFDNRVIDHLLGVYRLKSGRDVSNNARAMGKLKRAVEEAKRVLSTQMSARIDIEAFADGEDFNDVLTRAKFEELNVDLFRKTLKPVEQVLKDAGIGKGQVDEIVLVGGSTRIPKIQQLLRDYFGKELCKGINPDEAVAYGAAVQAAILSGDDAGFEDVVVLDVCPLSLGIETTGGIFTQIIPRNTNIPTKQFKTFSTAVDNQSSVLIQIYEGGRALTKDNNHLGEFELTGIPPAPRGVPEIDVNFEIDSNGILRVTATDAATSHSQAITISNALGRLSQDEIQRMINEAETFAFEDQLSRERIEKLNALKDYMHSVRLLLEKDDAVRKISARDKNAGSEALNNANDWIKTNGSQATTDEIIDRTKHLQSIIDTILQEDQSESPSFAHDSSDL